jgi:uncharacterized membrane protein YeaQ/YmgE (transglycosylase-associated protein family)
MIGMSFVPFLTLLVIGFIAAIVMHSVVRYRVFAGFDGFMGKWIFAWIGAWLGSPVLGHWGPHEAVAYVVPAFLGAFSGAFLMTLIIRALQLPADKRVLQMNPGPQSQLEMKKAS